MMSASLALAGPDASTSRAGDRPGACDSERRIGPREVSANGKRLTVYFWMGIQDCYGLGHVDVSRNDGQLKVQLWTGTQPDSVGSVCPELAQLYKTIVRLHRPLIQGGTI